MYNSSIESPNVKRCVAHMLKNMDYATYQRMLIAAEHNPTNEYKFVAMEYTYSPIDAPILHAEFVPGTREFIHNVIYKPDFQTNMARLFGDATYYTRRKTDLSKPPGEQLTNVRQLVVVIKDDMPGLIDVTNHEVIWDGNRTVMNPEDERHLKYSSIPTIFYPSLS